MPKFSVSYDIVTPESAEHGDVDDRGFIVEGVSFRNSAEEVKNTRTAHVDACICVEASDSMVEHARYITVFNGMEYKTGACESRSIHIPDSVTASSRRRIAKILGAI